MDFLPNFFPHSFNTLFFCNLHSYPNPQTLDFKGLQVLIHLSTPPKACLLYTSDAADEEDSVDLGGRRIIKKKQKKNKRERNTQ